MMQNGERIGGADFGDTLMGQRQEERQRQIQMVYTQAEQTLATNYWDNSTACNILFPILKPGARVVNVSSSMGKLST